MCFSFPRHHRRIARTICGKFAHIAVIVRSFARCRFLQNWHDGNLNGIYQLPFAIGSNRKVLRFPGVVRWNTRQRLQNLFAIKKAGLFPALLGVPWGIEPHTPNLSGFPKGHKKRQSEKLPF